MIQRSLVKSAHSDPRDQPPDGRPCYFARLEVENVRCFSGKQTLNFLGHNGEFAQWTILLGDNGVGKTTLLQALAAVLPRVRTSEKDKVFSAGVDRYPEWSNSLCRSDRSYAVVDVKLTFQSEDGWLDADAGFRYFDENGEVYRAVSLYPRAIGDFLAYGYGAMRRLHRAEGADSRHADACATLFDDEKPLLNAEQWLRNADYAASKSDTKEAQERLTKVKELLVDLLPDVSAVRIPARGAKVPVPEAETPFGWVPVNSLSTGYRSVLAWVIDLASRMLDRYPRSKNPFALPAVVLVDQVDLYLHPKWQREVMERLSRIFKKTQFIVTAHSPLIVQAVPDANITLLKRVGDEVHILNQPAEIRGWRTDQLLASDLFDNQPTRDEETEARMDERQELLARPTLSASAQRRLKKLDAQLAEVPYGESPEQAEMLALLKKAALASGKSTKK